MNRIVTSDESVLFNASHEWSKLSLEEVADSAKETLLKGNKIIFAGNGGSFADSIHLAAEFVSRFAFDRRPLSVLALGGNSSIMTSVGNDYRFEEVFSRELDALTRKGDVLIGISTSGNSINIIRVVQKALDRGLKVYCFTGKKESDIVKMCKCLRVPSDITARIQEAHITIGHIICGIVESELFDKK